MPHEVETMMYSVAEGPPWHGLGAPVAEAVDSEEALVKAGLAWAVEQVPLYLNRSPNAYEALFVEVPGWVANVRVTDGRALGMVSDKCRVVQNVEAFRFADQLLGEGVRYTTEGSLRGGQRIFPCAVLPDDVQLRGDRIAPHLVLTNSRDGSHGVRGQLPVRNRAVPTWFTAMRRWHSEKPETAYRIIELVSPGSRLELFARRRRPGWSAWGNEVESDVVLGGE